MTLVFNAEEGQVFLDKYSEKDVLIARLQDEVARLTQERDLWQSRAMDSASGGNKDDDQAKGLKDYIHLSKERLKSLLLRIHDVNISSVVLMVLQKSLPETASAEESRAIAEIITMPKQPTVSLTAAGDLKVEGNWNDIHDNKSVKL